MKSQRFLSTNFASVNETPCSNYALFFCPRSLGWCDTNMMVSICLVSHKVFKASNSALLHDGIADVFAKRLCKCKWAFKGFKEISCSDYITLLAFTTLGDVTRVWWFLFCVVSHKVFKASNSALLWHRITNNLCQWKWDFKGFKKWFCTLSLFSHSCHKKKGLKLLQKIERRFWKKHLENNFIKLSLIVIYNLAQI